MVGPSSLLTRRRGASYSDRGAQRPPYVGSCCIRVRVCPQVPETSHRPQAVPPPIERETMLVADLNGRAARVGRVRGARVLNGFLVLCLVSMMAAFAAVGARPSATGAQDGALETAALAPESVLL